jgi:6-phosphogluconolactonase/glucosamine-6-phosphate isomerase/deaminase
MEVVILGDAKEIGSVAADAIGALLDRKPDAVLGLATGSSPLAIYDALVARFDAGLISFRHARGFTLDEYVGLPADHPERYRNVIDRVFVSRVDFPAGGSMYRFSGSAPTGTSRSTSLAPRWRPEPASRRSPDRRGSTTPGSSATMSTRCRRTASPKVWPPSWRPGT